MGCAYRLAFVFLFISRLVCLGGCFSPNTRREKIQSALKVSTQSRRCLCADTAWSSETPCWGVTPVSCEGDDLSRHPSCPWRCLGECPGLLCWPQDPGHKTGLGGGVGGTPSLSTAPEGRGGWSAPCPGPGGPGLGRVAAVLPGRSRPGHEGQESCRRHRSAWGHPVCRPPAGRRRKPFPITLKLPLPQSSAAMSSPTWTPRRAARAQEGKNPRDAL